MVPPGPGVALGRRNLSPFPKPKAGAALVQHGIFAVIRHPIYTGLTLLVLGWGPGLEQPRH